MNNISNDDIKYMQEALKLAQKAYDNKEVPVGCVLVKDNEIIAKAYNTRHKNKSVIEHAEIKVLNQACKKLNSWILDNTTLYVTLEPCLMCAGAILQARVKRVVFATFEPKFGAAGSIMNVFDHNLYHFNHTVEVTSGILENESKMLLKDFFKELRK